MTRRQSEGFGTEKGGDDMHRDVHFQGQEKHAETVGERVTLAGVGVDVHTAYELPGDDLLQSKRRQRNHTVQLDCGYADNKALTRKSRSMQHMHSTCIHLDY